MRMNSSWVLSNIFLLPPVILCISLLNRWKIKINFDCSACIKCLRSILHNKINVKLKVLLLASLPLTQTTENLQYLSTNPFYTSLYQPHNTIIRTRHNHRWQPPSRTALGRFIQFKWHLVVLGLSTFLFFQIYIQHFQYFLKRIHITICYNREYFFVLFIHVKDWQVVNTYASVVYRFTLCWQ